MTPSNAAGCLRYAVTRLNAGERFDIAEWREKAGLNYTAAAAAIGCGRSTLVEYELGRREVPRHIALACIALNCCNAMKEKADG